MLESCVFESVKILFDVIESLFKGERRIKILPNKDLIQQKKLQEREEQRNKKPSKL